MDGRKNQNFITISFLRSRWLAIIAAEIVMSSIVGIGFFIWDAYQQNYISENILAVIYIGAVGLILDRAIAYLQNFIVPQSRTRQKAEDRRLSLGG